MPETERIKTSHVKRQISRAHSIVGVSRGRPPTDFYPTPPFAVEALLDREKFGDTIWEPACGRGSISEVLLRRLPHSSVWSSDLYDHGYGEVGVDFLKTSRCVDAVITNPPYGQAQEFVEHALECAEKVAMLVKIQFLEGARRYVLFQKHPPKTIYVFSKRLSLYREGVPMRNKGMICFTWIVWERGYNGRPQVEWICESERGGA